MGFSRCTIFFCVLIMLSCYFLEVGIAIGTISSSQFIKDPETLTSNGGKFTLGFFSPENSTDRFVGIWCESQLAVIWVANRNQPLKDSSGIVTISQDGNLVVMNGQKQVIWSTNVSNIASNSSCQLSDFGSLVLLENNTGNTLWESFQHPTDTFLPTMKFKSSKRTGEKVKFLTAWRSRSNPSIGSFSCSIERLNTPEMFIWNETRPYWRSGPWNGVIFTGIPVMTTSYHGHVQIVEDGEGALDLSYTVTDELELIIFTLNSRGIFEKRKWMNETKEWQVIWDTDQSDCDVYGICGPFASCSSQSSPLCSCLRGFEPRNIQEWRGQNWSSGCVRRTPLECERANTQNRSVDSKGDGFLKLQTVKVPAFAQVSTVIVTQDSCRSKCLENCFCIAYSFDVAIGCMYWTGNLIDMQQFTYGGLDLYIRVAYTELDKGRNKTVIITITVLIGTVIIVICACVKWRRTSKHPGKKKSKEFLLSYRSERSDEGIELSQVLLPEILLFNLEKLAIATKNFHLSNKLGQGGFGPVYKGELEDGQEIAIKRLSGASEQGLEEFMNEVVVISKLQHRNLVKLLGCCIEGDEKMLIYEYMPNKSLDAFVFDAPINKFLDWRKRFSIIEGIARGLLYLHRDSRLRIIHRDLKVSNILLDEQLNPKISDFGMARIFKGGEDQANTRRVVGTYGYMSPEYAMQGLFSEKSDVFSFGVLLLEIISGRRISSFYDSEHSLTLLGFAWIQWREDNILNVIDPRIYDPGLHEDILRCLHIGLLCVQELAIDRPTISSVISMFSNEIANLPLPKQPAFTLRQNMLSSISSEESHGLYSVNTVSITDIHGR